MGLLSKMDKMDLGILIAEEVCEKRVHEQNVNQLQKRVEELEKEVKDLTEHNKQLEKDNEGYKKLIENYQSGAK
jgi:uncharacterized protein YlxW (UPF0749 family)